MDGLRFERRGEGDYYKVILHVESCFVPVSDDTVEELKSHSGLMGDRLLEFFLDRVGYSSYLKENIKKELAKEGDLPKQVTALRQLLLNL